MKMIKLIYKKWISVFAIFLFVGISALQSQNYVTTYAGTGSIGFVNGDTSIASFNRPFGICLDAEGNVYIADAYNHCIRKISTNGEVSTYAGTGSAGYQDGGASIAKFNQPINICMDDEGNMYVSDFINQRIRKISNNMLVTTIAGSGVAGHANGFTTEAMFNYPRGICRDDNGNLYIGDSWNHRIRKISVEGIVSDWAGGGDVIGVQSVGDYVDASDTAARFYTPCEVSIDQWNNIYVADAYNHRIRKIDADRMVTTVAGNSGFGPDGGGFLNGPGEIAEFDVPTAVHIAPDGNIFVGDGSNQVMRRINLENYVSTFAGTGEAGFLDGVDSLAMFDFPRGSVMDVNLNRLYVVDYNNHAIRIIHLDAYVGEHEVFSSAYQVRVFPNPSSGKFMIGFSEAIDNYSIQVINLLGKVVFEENKLVENYLEIDISCEDDGVYFIKIAKGEDLIAVKKMILDKVH
ncbi:MAG: T9SS type A sorting domain-containing protein [Bacteroidales bacterium]|jgi:sugar lactone lactonase YvrE|nr:T9SS type A sorting domain-containing protein [Bacteroidales bacterium]